MKINNIIINHDVDLNPYYIVAPIFTAQSAGIKVLYLLCHHLNTKGYPAFLLNIEGFGSDKYYKAPKNFIAPIATTEQIKSHLSDGLNPIIIYPDTIKGNPLEVDNYVRYLLHYPGFFGGEVMFKNELIFSYSKKIANKVGVDNILFMPISDTKIFYPPVEKRERVGFCLYADKYQNYFGNSIFDSDKEFLEIKRREGSQSQIQIAEIFRNSKCFFVYEESSLIIESLLCDCPVVVRKNKIFDGDLLASFEIGNYGIMDEYNEKNLLKATSEIQFVKDNFSKAIDSFWIQLDNFIKLTQKYSKTNINNHINFNVINKVNFKKKKVPFVRKIKKRVKDLFKNNINV